MSTSKDPLKEQVANAALEAAGAAIGDALEGEAFVEPIQLDPLVRQYRVSPTKGAPRYFSVTVKEHM